LLDLSVVTEPPYLLPALNFTFTTAIGVFVAVLAGMSFMRQPAPGVLLIGTGTLIFGLVSLGAGIAIHLKYINTGITVYNVGACLAGICHLLATFALVTWRKPLLGRVKLWTAVGFAAGGLIPAALILLAWEQLLPTFFIQGQGPRPVRQVVLAGAIASFALSAVLLTFRGRWHAGVFTNWYAMGLALIATGLLAVMPIDQAGTPLGWLGRSAQYLGGIYLLIAVLAAAHRSGHWDTALQIALRQSRDRFRALVAASAQMVWTTDPQGRLIEDSPSWRAYTGQTYAQAQGWGWADAVHPDHREQLIEAWTRSLETLETFEAEYLTHHHSGQWRWTEARAVPVFEPDGEVSGWVGMSVDIHERKRAEEALRESEDRFRAMADGVAQIIWLMDAEGNQHFVNKPYLEFFGLNRSEAQTSRWRDLIHPEDAEDYLRKWKEAFDQRKDFRAECRALRADGQWRWVESVARPRFDEQGRFAGYVGTSPDITDRKRSGQALLRARDELERRVSQRTAQLHNRAEQLAQLTSELTLAEQRERRRLAQVLHDHLQQLLVGAKFGLDVLHRKVPDDDREGVAQVAELIDEALNASRSLTVEISPPILHEAGLAAGLEWLGRWMTQKHGLQVKCNVDPNARTSREDVRVLLFQAARELLFNVVKHAGVTEAQVKLDQTEHMLRVTVTDAGKGFDPENLCVGRRPEGGFGLFSIRERLALLGGRVEIESRPGEGASFTLTAPAQSLDQIAKGQGRDAQKPQPPATGAPDKGAAGSQAIRLLLVDDHEVMRQGLAMMLSEQENLRVVGEASTGLEAIKQARRLEPDVVLMDFSMPEMDGVEATEKLRQQMPDITVIGLSMYDQSDRSQAMIDAGASAYLSKSGPPAELLDTIHRLHAESAGSNGGN